MKDNDRKATCYNNWNTLNTQHVQPQSRYYSSLIPQETEATIRQRLTKDKTREDWKNAARSDESLVLLLHSDGRVRTWSKQHKGMDLSCLVSTFQAGGGVAAVWRIFSWHTLVCLVPTEHPLNATAFLRSVADCVHCFITNLLYYPAG